MSQLAITMTEWSRLGPGEDERLAGHSFEDSDTAREQARQLTESGRLEIRELREGLVIRTNSNVGSLQLGDLRIQIQPKISGIPLLNLLRYAYDLRDLEMHALADQPMGESNFLDLLIMQLRVEAQELISRGLHRDYERVDGLLSSPRGRIDFQKYALRGGAAEATLPCIHHPRLQNNLVNRVLLSGLYLAAQMASSLMLRTELRRLSALLSGDVAPIRLDWQVMDQVWRGMDRRMKAYEPTIKLIGMLLQMKGFLLEEPSQQMRLPGFLFDMNRFFQTLLSRFLHENLRGYVVQDEYHLKDMMSYAVGYNPRKRRSPAPRPDYVITKNGHVSAILDAKYIDLWEHEPPASILYQLTIYALSQGWESAATILYPTMDDSASEARIDVRDLIHGRAQAQITLRPVHLGQLDQLVMAKSDYRIRDRRTALATSMIFGDKEGF